MLPVSTPFYDILNFHKILVCKVLVVILLTKLVTINLKQSLLSKVESFIPSTFRFLKLRENYDIFNTMCHTFGQDKKTIYFLDKLLKN